MTPDEQTRRLLVLLAGIRAAVDAMPTPKRGRQQGDPIDPQYWTDRQLETLLSDIRDENGAAS